MNLSVKSTGLLLFLSSLIISLNAQSVAGLGVVPVGTYQRIGANGEKEFISSVGGAKVGVFRSVRPPLPLYRIRRNPPKTSNVPVTGRIAGVLAGVLGGVGAGVGGLLGGLLG